MLQLMEALRRRLEISTEGGFLPTTTPPSLPTLTLLLHHHLGPLQLALGVALLLGVVLHRGGLPSPSAAFSAFLSLGVDAPAGRGGRGGGRVGGGDPLRGVVGEALALERGSLLGGALLLVLFLLYRSSHPAAAGGVVGVAFA